MKKRILLISIVIFVSLIITGLFFVNKAFDMLFEAGISDLKMEPAKDIKVESDKALINAHEDEPITSVKKEVPKAINDNISVDGKNSAAEKKIDKSNTLNNETNSNTEETSSSSFIPKADPKEVEKPKSTDTKVITPQTIAAVEKKVSAADKSKAIQIILSKLTADDIAKLKALAKGGMTPAKTDQAKEIVKSRVTSKDIEELKQLYYKYVN
jgi:hypothetical protein